MLLFNTQVMLLLLLLLLFVLLAATVAAPSTSFAVIGDWGARARDRHAQRAVAAQLQHYNQKIAPLRSVLAAGE